MKEKVVGYCCCVSSYCSSDKAGDGAADAEQKWSKCGSRWEDGVWLPGCARTLEQVHNFCFDHVMGPWFTLPVPLCQMLLEEYLPRYHRLPGLWIIPFLSDQSSPLQRLPGNCPKRHWKTNSRKLRNQWVFPNHLGPFGHGWKTKDFQLPVYVY